MGAPGPCRKNGEAYTASGSRVSEILGIRAVGNPEEIEDGIEAEGGDGVLGFLAHERLGAVGNAHAGETEHGEIIGAIANGDGLIEGNSLFSADCLQHLSFALTVHNGRNDVAGNEAIDDFEFVGMEVINAKTGLQMTSEEGEAAGEDCGLVTLAFQRGNETFAASGDGNAIEQFEDPGLGQAAEQREAAGEALLEIEFAAHGGLGDARDFFSYAFHLGQLINDLGLDEGGVHVEDNEAAGAAELGYGLDDDVDSGYREEGSTQLGGIEVLTADTELHAGWTRRTAQRFAGTETFDGVKVKAMSGVDPDDRTEVGSGQDGSHHGHDEAVGVRQRGKSWGTDLVDPRSHPEVVGLGEDGFLQSVYPATHFENQGERNAPIDDARTAVKDAGAVFLENREEGTPQPGFIVSGNRQEQNLIHGLEITPQWRWNGTGNSGRQRLHTTLIANTHPIESCYNHPQRLGGSFSFDMGVFLIFRGRMQTRQFLFFLLILIGCGLTSFSFGQDGGADASAQIMQSYEGQNVSTVEIAGRPDLDAAKYDALVQLKQGEPFSTEKIGATIEALKKVGDFKDVVLDLRPETTGVRVMFVVQPAYYIALYDFPGALKVNAYSRLIQVANYRAQEPYSAVDVQAAQVALENFFHQTGYFEATVQPEIRTNQQHGIVNVLFNTDLKRRAKYGEIKLTGSTPEETAYLETKVGSFMARIRGARLKEGKPYSSHQLQLATTYLQRTLAKQQHLAANVKFVTAEYNASTNRADVTFHVNAGPKVQLQVTGGHIWPWDKKRLIPIYAENSIDEDLIQEGQQNLLSNFQSKGFYDAVVQVNVAHNPNTTIITYAINKKNAKHKVEKVSVQGNTSLSEKDLLNHSDVEKAHWFSHGKYSEQLVRKSANNLKAVYQNAGYSQMKVTPRVTRDRGNIAVAFVVQEGARDFVSELQITGNNTVPVSQLAPKGLMLGTNKPYSPLLEQQDRNAITAHYLLNGYLTASVTSKAKPVQEDPHHLVVTYTIHEGPKVTTAQVVLVGKEHTKQELITKTANIKVGTPLSEGELLSSESRLYTLGIFDWAEVDPKRALTDQTSEDVLVKVHESKRNTITYGFGFEVINRGGSVPSGTVSVPGIPPVGLPQGFKTSQNTYYGPAGHGGELYRRWFCGTTGPARIGDLYGSIFPGEQLDFFVPGIRRT